MKTLGNLNEDGGFKSEDAFLPIGTALLPIIHTIKQFNGVESSKDALDFIEVAIDVTALAYQITETSKEKVKEDLGL